MDEQEIKQKLTDNGFESLIPIFEENHLMDMQALSLMTDSDYQSIGVTVLGDRKKLLYIFQNSKELEEKDKQEQNAVEDNTNEEESKVDKEKKEEFINIEKNGREYCYRKTEPGILLCRKCHHRVAKEQTLCSNCNNSLVHSDTVPIIKKEETHSSNNKNYTSTAHKSKFPAKIVVPLILLAIVGTIGLFAYKSVNKSNYSDNLYTVFIKITASSAEAEECINLIHSVWYNKIFDKYSSKTIRYTQHAYDFNDALDNLFSDVTFKNKINKIKKDSSDIVNLMKGMTNPPSDFRDAYIKLTSCYEDYVKLVSMATSPTGNLTSYTQNFNRLDSSLVSELSSLELYLK